MNPVTELCRQLRNNSTKSEIIIWEYLRRRNVNGKKFLRQFPIFVVNGFGRRNYYIADFYCAECNLVIEIDGPVHLLKKDYDANRDIVMQERGLKVLRFTNELVEQKVEQVLQIIENHL